MKISKHKKINIELEIYLQLSVLEQLGEGLANSITNDNSSIETLVQENKLLLEFVNRYLSINSSLKTIISEYQKIKDSEIFRNKIIDKEIEILTKYQEMLEVGKIIDRPTDLEILKIQTQSAFETTVKMLEKLKDTYKKNEDTLIISFVGDEENNFNREL